MEVRYPPPQKGYLSDTCAIPHETRRMGAIPPLRYYLERVLCDMGGVSRTGPLSQRGSFRDRCPADIRGVMRADIQGQSFGQGPRNPGIPLTPDRRPNPHFPEKRVSGSKNPHFPSPSQRLEKGVFGPKIPIFYVFPCRKKGFF